MSRLGNRPRRTTPTSRSSHVLVSPWRLCLAILTTIGLLTTSGHCRSTAKSFSQLQQSQSQQQATLPQRRTLNQEIGSPSELAWQAWLLVGSQNHGQSAFDSSNILRRITPKSIFIAPELVSCPSGYSTNGKGVCKPDPIKINEDAQREFFLKRLNALYGKFGNNRKKPDAAAIPVATGPLQINIPIQLPPRTNVPEPVQPLQPPVIPITHRVDPGNRLPSIPTTTTTTTPRPTTMTTMASTESQRREDPVAVVVYKVANDTRSEAKLHQSTERTRTTFFLGASGAEAPQKGDAQVDPQVVPVAEIVDDMNETFSGVVDYSEKRMPQSQPQQYQPNRGIPAVELDDRFSDPIGISQQASTHVDFNRSQDPVTVTVYKLPDDTTKRQREPTEDDRTMFFAGNTYSPVRTTTDILSGHATPAPEVVDDVNETFSGVADNKIPVHQKTAPSPRDTQTTTRAESTQRPVQLPLVQRPNDQGVTAADQLPVPLELSQQPTDRQRNSWTQEPVAVLVYKVKNEPKKGQEEPEENARTTFFLGSSNAPTFQRETTQISQVVPLEGFTDQVKETSYSPTRFANDRFPVSFRSVFNRSDIFEQSRTSDLRAEAERLEDRRESSEDMSPTVVLLLTPTRVPYATSTNKQQAETTRTNGFEQTTTMTTPMATDLETEYTESTTTLPTTLSLDNTYNRSTDSFDQTTMTDGRYPTENTDEPDESSEQEQEEEEEEEELSSTMLWLSTQTETPAFARMTTTTTTAATTNVDREDGTGDSTEFDIFDVTE